MRRRQKQQILELLKTLEVAQLASLYADCQQGALQIGEFIEAVEGEGTQTVALLEEYCELLFQASQGKLCEKQLRIQLVRIENSVKDELRPGKIEVVFLPYQASMWDSFESIWLAARNDPQCDAYVVAIPYYDRLPSGAFGQMHDEGGLYPDYVPITDWREYDFAARQPDIVFTHNPYDQHNTVTTVHPDYYSGALKQHTDFLVYVDYGIPYRLSKNPTLSITVDNAKVLPSRLHCDLVVAYSEEHAALNKRALSVCPATKHLFGRGEANKKIVALGNPKFDKVLNARKEAYALADGWESVIGNKKIMLYSTSLSGLLKAGEKKLDEMTRVIEVMSKRDDIVLWWRPHPLIESTLKSMRPELAEKYSAIVEGYRHHALGIFDDTMDVHRAIVWGDGYLTDFSSMAFLYLASGKPFTILAADVKLPQLTTKQITTFHEPLRRRMDNMKAAKGANVYDLNTCIWWNNFLPVNIVDRTRYDRFLDLFADFVVHAHKYPEAEEYRQLQLQMFRDFVANPDGTAGEKIYQYCKECIGV